MGGGLEVWDGRSYSRLFICYMLYHVRSWHLQNILNNIKCSYLKYMSGSYLFTDSEISSKISSEPRPRGEEIRFDNSWSIVFIWQIYYQVHTIIIISNTWRQHRVYRHTIVMIFSKYESSIYMEIALIIEIGNIEMRQNIVWILVGMFYRILIQYGLCIC